MSDGDSKRAELINIASVWGGRAERRFLPAEQLPVVRGVAVDAVELLCSMGWAERGLETACSQCTIRSFHPMPQTTSTPVCPVCSAPVDYMSDAGHLRVVYRLDGIVDRAADHGVLPHLLVTAALTRDKPLSYFFPGTDLTFADGHTPEVDIFGIWDENLLAGEIKTSANEFSTEQLQRDVALSKRVGADVHLLAAVNTVPKDIVDEARKLCGEAGLELVVYDKDRLRPPTGADEPADTADDVLGHLQDALDILLKDLPDKPGAAAKKAGLILKTALAPRSPSAGQVAALAAAINQWGPELVDSLEAARARLADLATRSEDTLTE
ncbi:hypothetical protein ACFY3M_38260 [Streptomyces mirabilis]|uniref:hypothetical protein n=1 Tax=Streptomyces mirabilis TaxID=68239 RepID=UPI0036BE0521